MRLNSGLVRGTLTEVLDDLCADDDLRIRAVELGQALVREGLVSSFDVFYGLRQKPDCVFVATFIHPSDAPKLYPETTHTRKGLGASPVVRPDRSTTKPDAVSLGTEDLQVFPSSTATLADDDDGFAASPFATIRLEQ